MTRSSPSWRLTDEGDDVFSTEAQQKANPNYGISVKPEYLKRQAEKAKIQPGFYNEYVPSIATAGRSRRNAGYRSSAGECEPEPVDREHARKGADRAAVLRGARSLDQDRHHRLRARFPCRRISTI
jgi:hypothetical protein